MDTDMETRLTNRIDTQASMLGLQFDTQASLFNAKLNSHETQVEEQLSTLEERFQKDILNTFNLLRSEVRNDRLQDEHNPSQNCTK